MWTRCKTQRLNNTSTVKHCKWLGCSERKETRNRTSETLEWTRCKTRRLNNSSKVKHGNWQGSSMQTETVLAHKHGTSNTGKSNRACSQFGFWRVFGIVGPVAPDGHA